MSESKKEEKLKGYKELKYGKIDYPEDWPSMKEAEETMGPIELQKFKVKREKFRRDLRQDAKLLDKQSKKGTGRSYKIPAITRKQARDNKGGYLKWLERFEGGELYTFRAKYGGKFVAQVTSKDRREIHLSQKAPVSGQTWESEGVIFCIRTNKAGETNQFRPISLGSYEKVKTIGDIFKRFIPKSKGKVHASS